MGVGAEWGQPTSAGSGRGRKSLGAAATELIHVSSSLFHKLDGAQECPCLHLGPCLAPLFQTPGAAALCLLQMKQVTHWLSQMGGRLLSSSPEQCQARKCQTGLWQGVHSRGQTKSWGHFRILPVTLSKPVFPCTLLS